MIRRSRYGQAQKGEWKRWAQPLMLSRLVARTVGASFHVVDVCPCKAEAESHSRLRCCWDPQHHPGPGSEAHSLSPPPPLYTPLLEIILAGTAPQHTGLCSAGHSESHSGISRPSPLPRGHQQAWHGCMGMHLRHMVPACGRLASLGFEASKQDGRPAPATLQSTRKSENVLGDQ